MQDHIDSAQKSKTKATMFRQRLQGELDALRAELDTLLAERDTLLAERDALRAEHETNKALAERQVAQVANLEDTIKEHRKTEQSASDDLKELSLYQSHTPRFFRRLCEILTIALDRDTDAIEFDKVEAFHKAFTKFHVRDQNTMKMVLTMIEAGVFDEVLGLAE